MDFLKGLLRNLAFLICIGIILLILFPSQMSQVYELYGGLFGPIAILLLIGAALPRNTRKKKD